jgi:hypothetical protein
MSAVCYIEGERVKAWRVMVGTSDERREQGRNVIFFVPIIGDDKPRQRQSHCRPPRRPIDLRDPTHPRNLIPRDASSKVDKVEQIVHIRRLPAHFLVGFLETNSGSVQRKGEPSAVVGEREG